MRKRAIVYLVGAGPGDPELLTVKALRLIESADVILHDDLVPQAILNLAHASEDCECGQALRRQEHHAGRDQRADGGAGAGWPKRGAAKVRRPADFWARGGRDGGAARKRAWSSKWFRESQRHWLRRRRFRHR